MSEKRFTFGVLNSNLVEIKDNEEPMNIGEVVDLLNELHNENKELKKENEQLRKELGIFNPVRFQDMLKGTVTLYSKDGIDE